MICLAIRVRLARSVTHTTGTVPVCRLTAVRSGVPIATLTAAPPATNALPQDEFKVSRPEGASLVTSWCISSPPVVERCVPAKSLDRLAGLLFAQHADLRVGTVISLQPVRPSSENADDRRAAERFDAMWNGACLDGLTNSSASFATLAPIRRASSMPHSIWPRFSFRLRFVIQPIYFVSRIQRAAEHPNCCLMPIFVGKCAPSDHCLLQGRAFDRTSGMSQGRRL